MRHWLQLLHFGPSLFTTLAFGVYVVIGGAGRPPADRLALLLLGQLLTQFAISLLNDYWDLPLDRISKPDKPLPAGLVSPRLAWRLGGIAAALALALAVPLGVRTLACAALGLAAGVAYDFALKRTLASPLPFAVGFGVLPLWAWAGLDRAWDGRVLWAAALTALLVLPLHLADTLPDLEADQAAGLRGLAHRLGRRRTLVLCWASLALGLLLAALLGFVLSTHLPTLAATLLVGTSLLGLALAIYRRNPQALRLMAGPIEAAALLTSLGWLAAVSG